MHSLAVRREAVTGRAEHEAHKAILFAERHGGWPIDLSPAAGVVLARRHDANELEAQWGDLAEAIALAH
jgi:hypothetical protein